MRSTDLLWTAERVARRTERERQRRAAYRQRLQESAEALRKHLPPPSIADLQSLVSWAEIWMVQPITCGWRWQNDLGHWQSSYGPDLRRAPHLRLQTTPSVEQPPCSFSPESIDWHGYDVQPLNCWISANATQIAMSVRSRGPSPLTPMLQAFVPIVESAPGLRRPLEAGVQILAGDELFCPFDFRLQDQEERPYRDPAEDGAAAPEMLTLMIAFDPFVGEVAEFSVIFLPSPEDLIAPSEFLSIKCSGPFVTASTKGLAEFPKIVDGTTVPGK